MPERSPYKKVELSSAEALFLLNLVERELNASEPHSIVEIPGRLPAGLHREAHLKGLRSVLEYAYDETRDPILMPPLRGHPGLDKLDQLSAAERAKFDIQDIAV